MVSNSLFLLTVFVFINKVVCETLEAKFRVEKFIEQTYPYNHPPAAELYNPIPVAVVYEDSYDLSRNAETKHISDTFEDEKEIIIEDKFLVSKNDNENTATEEKTGKHVTNEKQTKSEIKPKARGLSEFQIPVAVVYDKDPHTYPNNKRTKTDTHSAIPKVRSNYAPEKQIRSDIEKVPQTTVIETKDAQQSGGSRTFKKRTEVPDPIVPIIDMENYVFSHNGNFRYSYEGGDGTKAYSEGKQVTVDEGTGEAVVGGFSYKDKDGNDFSLTYTADENGYRPVGDHLPTPPPIPPAIARALAYLATATSEPVTKSPGKS